jgi:hypothetical protein
MIVITELPKNVLACIATAFHEENGYLEPAEVAGWLRAKGSDIEVRRSMVGTDNVYIFPSEQDYAVFLLRWS